MPPEVPGVVDGVAFTGAAVGSPLPGVRFVEQPKAARESDSESAATVETPFRLLDFVVMTKVSCRVIDSNDRAIFLSS